MKKDSAHSPTKDTPQPASVGEVSCNKATMTVSEGGLAPSNSMFVKDGGSSLRFLLATVVA